MSDPKFIEMVENPQTNVWESRIVGHGFVDPVQLLHNPDNFRIHPVNQQEAMTGILETVGWLTPVIVNETTGHIIDGHMRVEIAARSSELVPVAFVRLSQEEERAALAVYDRVGDMAIVDERKIAELLASVPSIDGGAMDAMLQSLRDQYGEISAGGSLFPGGDVSGGTIQSGKSSPDDFASYGDDIKTDHTCPRCGYEFSGNG